MQQQQQPTLIPDRSHQIINQLKEKIKDKNEVKIQTEPINHLIGLIQSLDKSLGDTTSILTAKVNKKNAEIGEKDAQINTLKDEVQSLNENLQSQRQKYENDSRSERQNLSSIKNELSEKLQNCEQYMQEAQHKIQNLKELIKQEYTIQPNIYKYFEIIEALLRQDFKRASELETNLETSILTESPQKKQKPVLSVSSEDNFVQQEKQQQQQVNCEEEGYDIQIQFKNMKDMFKNGVKVNRSQSITDEEFKLMMVNPIIQVGFLGNMNAGKSFCASQITKKKILQGYSTQTIGFNWLVKNGISYIDSQGLMESLKLFKAVDDLRLKYAQAKEGQNIEEMQKIKQMHEEEIKKVQEEQTGKYQEQLSFEKFQQTFIVKECEVIIYVTNILTLEEEKHINIISKKIEELNAYGASQTLLVLHNLQSVESLEEAEKLISKCIKSNFNTGLENLEQDFFYIDYGKKQSINSSIQHFIICKEGSEAGNYYNTRTFSYIRQLISKLNIQKQSRNCFQAFSDYINQELCQYINLEDLKDLNKQQKYNQPKFSLNESNDKIIDPQYENIDESSVNYVDLSLDFLGQVKYRLDGVIQPAYEIYKTEDYYYILIGLYGIHYLSRENFKKQLNINDKQQWVLTFQGQHNTQKISEVLEKEGINQQNLVVHQQEQSSQLKFGYFETQIVVCDSKIQLDKSNVKLELVSNGNKNPKESQQPSLSLFKVSLQIIKQDQNNDVGGGFEFAD